MTNDQFPMTNEDVVDLFSRVDVGTKVVVLPKRAPLEARHPLRPATTAALAGSAVPARADSLTIGHPSLSFYEVTAHVIQFMFERMGWKLGQTITLRGTIFTLVIVIFFTGRSCAPVCVLLILSST